MPRAEALPRDAALAELASRYFTGHGPATVSDFAWWSGLSRPDARLATHLARARLDEESVGGHTVWFQQKAGRPAARPSGARLLPAFDEYVIGYADRSAVLDLARVKLVNAGGGILKPILVYDGQVVGIWRRRFARGKVLFLPAPFRPLAKTKLRSLQTEFARYAAFLGIPAAL